MTSTAHTNFLIMNQSSPHSHTQRSQFVRRCIGLGIFFILFFISLNCVVMSFVGFFFFYLSTFMWCSWSVYCCVDGLDIQNYYFVVKLFTESVSFCLFRLKYLAHFFKVFSIIIITHSVNYVNYKNSSSVMNGKCAQLECKLHYWINGEKKI